MSVIDVYTCYALAGAGSLIGLGLIMLVRTEHPRIRPSAAAVPGSVRVPVGFPGGAGHPARAHARSLAPRRGAVCHRGHPAGLGLSRAQRRAHTPERGPAHFHRFGLRPLVRRWGTEPGRLPTARGRGARRHRCWHLARPGARAVALARASTERRVGPVVHGLDVLAGLGSRALLLMGPPGAVPTPPAVGPRLADGALGHGHRAAAAVGGVHRLRHHQRSPLPAGAPPLAVRRPHGHPLAAGPARARAAVAGATAGQQPGRGAADDRHRSLQIHQRPPWPPGGRRGAAPRHPDAVQPPARRRLAGPLWRRGGSR